MSIIRIQSTDGGSRNLGLSVIDYNVEEKTVSCLDATHFVSIGATIPEQLSSIADFYKVYLDTWQPSVFVYEAMVFKGRFAATNSIGIQNAMGVLRLIAYRKKLQEFSYSPRHIKLATTGNAKADKEQIISVVNKTFPDLQIKKSHNHASDAVAIGLTYLIDQYKIKL